MKGKELLFFKVIKNTKRPIKNEKYSNPKTLKPLASINKDYYNIGLPCKVNNLLILDIDEKNEGLEEWAEYLTDNVEPLTVKQKTPNNGYHYIFNETNDLYTEEENILIKRLKNKAGYRNKGIDIRKGNGYILCEPSTIDNKKYKFVRHYKDNEILNMPLELIKWILEKEEYTNNNVSNNLLIIMRTEDQLKLILKQLIEYVDISKQWIKITACIKNLLHKYNDFNELQLYIIWDEWSKKGDKYEEHNNKIIWDSLVLNINFNYFVDKYNNTVVDKKKKIEYFKTIKDYVPIINDISNIKLINMDNHHIYDEKYKGIQLTEEIFNNNSTIIVESTTGTGKTSNVANFCKKYEETGRLKERIERYKILSIVSRVSLASQHIQSFNEHNINIMSYKDEKTDIEDDNIVICINSILKYSKYKPEFFNNYIVYIDEINTFTRHLTHNSLLSSKLKLIYITLMKIINNCHKLILTEALISDNVFNFCGARPNEKKVFIKNSFKKYQNIEAIKHNDENIFLQTILNQVNNNEFFLFGCDSKDIITKYYNECYKIAPDKCLLITADIKFELLNVNEQFINKFVFYSPSITCGINFDIENKQDVFLYINGLTLEPCDSFQQATRTRNIKKLNYYINELKEHKPLFNTLEDTTEHFKNIKNIHLDNEKIANLVNLCLIIDKNDNLSFNETSFFKLFIYNEYLTDIYKTNKEYHFKQILRINGYTMKDINETKKLKKPVVKKMKEDKEEYTKKKFIQHIENIEPNELIEDTLYFLKLLNDDDKIKYEKIVMNSYLRDDYHNLIRLFYDDNAIIKRYDNLNKNNVAYKTIFSTYNKIKLLKELETETNISRFQIDHKGQDEPVTISEKLYKKINIAFRSVEKMPLTYNKLINYYVAKLNNIIGKLDIIEKSNDQINNKRMTRYKINETSLKYYMDLNYLSNCSRVEFDKNLLKRFENIIIVEDISKPVFPDKYEPDTDSDDDN